MTRLAFALLATLLATGSAHAVLTKNIKADCKARPVVDDLSLSACQKSSILELSVWAPSRATKKKKASAAGALTAFHTFKFELDPEGSFDGRVQVQGANGRFLAVAYENSECTEVRFLNYQDKTVPAETGCVSSTHCKVVKFPGDRECEATVECGEGALRTKTTYALCK